MAFGMTANGTVAQLYTDNGTYSHCFNELSIGLSLRVGERSDKKLYFSVAELKAIPLLKEPSKRREESLAGKRLKYA
jgi:hypothetical protein